MLMDKADLSIFSSLDARKYHSWSFELDPCLNKRRRSGGQVLQIPGWNIRAA